MIECEIIFSLPSLLGPAKAIKREEEKKETAKKMRCDDRRNDLTEMIAGEYTNEFHFSFYDKLRIVESIKKLFSQISRRYRRAKIEKYCGRETLQTTFCNRFLGCDLNNFKGKGRLVAKWTSEGSRNVHNPLAEGTLL